MTDIIYDSNIIAKLGNIFLPDLFNMNLTIYNGGNQRYSFSLDDSQGL